MRRRRTVEYVPASAPRRPGDNPWLWLGLLAALVVALAVVVWALARDDDPERKAAPSRPVVPNLIGLDQTDAGVRAQAAGIVADTFGVPSSAPFGQVVAQEPDAGIRLGAGRHLRLNVSEGTEERAPVVVPDVSGTAADAAREALWRLGLGVLTQEADGERGVVLRQEPAAGRSVPPLTQVTLTVGA